MSCCLRLRDSFEALICLAVHLPVLLGQFHQLEACLLACEVYLLYTLWSLHNGVFELELGVEPFNTSIMATGISFVIYILWEWQHQLHCFINMATLGSLEMTECRCWWHLVTDLYWKPKKRHCSKMKTYTEKFSLVEHIVARWALSHMNGIDFQKGIFTPKLIQIDSHP